MVTSLVGTGILLTVLVVVAAVIPANPSLRVGDQDVRPATVDGVQARYSHGIGTLTIDLREVEFDAVRLALAPTAAREGRCEEGWEWAPGQFATISAPTLMLAGSDSPAPVARCTQLAAEAIPNVRVRTLVGHGHMAHVTDPALVARLISEFVA